jgi:hypothetical protein
MSWRSVCWDGNNNLLILEPHGVNPWTVKIRMSGSESRHEDEREEKSIREVRQLCPEMVIRTVD